MSEVKFTVNGKPHIVSSTIDADTTLNSYLRNHVNLRGTKAMCHEGGCGACVVSVSAPHPVSKKPEILSVNSCLVAVMSCHGWDITTIEGIGNKKDGYHPIQSRLAFFNGTQCGYCSPGWVMNMYSLHQKDKKMSMKDIENSFAGNMCRCTGYRPILDAFKTFSDDCDKKLLDQIVDIEEISTNICTKTGTICAKTCDDYMIEGDFCVINMARSMKDIALESNNLQLTTEETKWFKVYNLNDLFDIFEKEGTESYSLVAGNTARGVYHVKTLPKVMIDITGISELRKCEMDADMVLGATMTLNEAMKYFMDVASKNDYFKYTLQMRKHMDLIAHIPVRNIGTLAGNLSIKHQNREFQSDIFLLLETVGATLTIVEKDKKTIKRSAVTLQEYLNLNMKGKVIHCINLPPLSEDYVYQTYKIMPRAQNAHAHVNAGFLFKFNSDKSVVEKASIVYGGIDPHFIHATATEKLLVGKNIFTNDNLKLALQSLSGEISPNVMPPEPTPEYRKKLALGLFYKCILHISPPNLIDVKNKSGGDEFDRPVSSGQQKFDTNKDLWPLNEPVNKLEALVQCAGEAKFVNDLPTQPNEVYAAFVLSTVHDGNIDKIDGTDVLAMKGVVALFTATDIPGINGFTPNISGLPEQEEIICSGKILFNGQPVAIIVAETERLAKLAAEKVKVTYKNTGNNPPIVNIRDALKSSTASARVVRDQTIEPKEKGNDIKKVIKGTFDIFGQYHYTMETQSCIVVPIEDGLDVYSSTQWMDLTHLAIAETLKIPLNSININVRRLGGGYGSKISRSVQIATACALAASKLNRPVRFVLPLETNMIAVGKRLPCSNDYEVGVNEEGKIQYLRNIFYEDDGCSHNENISLSTAAAFKNCYDDKTWYIEVNSVLTDTPSNTWCRGPGSTEAVAMIENIMEHIAFETKKDPLEVRLANMNTTDNPLPELIKTLKESAEFDKRSSNVKQFNASNRWRKRGISIVPLKYGLEYWGNFASLVSVYHGDGTVSVSHAGIEMGQGLNTKVAQVCAHTLGISLEMVSIKPSNNLTAPNAIVTGGSIGSETCSYATIRACQILIDRLEPIKKSMDKPTWPELIKKAYYSGVDLCAHYMFTVLDEVKPYDIWGVSIAEVEVDMLTGNHQLIRVDILEDTGESLSPHIDVGQVEGAYIMGVGYWTCENLIYDKTTGALLTNRTWNYKPPGIKDIPIDFRIQFRQNAPNPAGVLRSKATGEPPLNMAVGILTAIRQAITSARTDSGLPEDVWYDIDMPLTPENIILATKTSIDEYKL